MPDNDYAVLTLSTPVVFTETTMPICLPDPNERYENNIATAAGWGIDNHHPFGRPSPSLLIVNTTTMSNENCKAALPLTPAPPAAIPGAITANMICAFEPGQAVCNGDSGGPLITLSKDRSYYLQIGIVSWGFHCESIQMYSRVTEQMYWIMRQITGDTCAPPVDSF